MTSDYKQRLIVRFREEKPHVDFSFNLLQQLKYNLQQSRVRLIALSSPSPLTSSLNNACIIVILKLTRSFLKILEHKGQKYINRNSKNEFSEQ